MLNQLTPELIKQRMTGELIRTDEGKFEALLPSPCVQNHAAFLSVHNRKLTCHWFGGSLEGKSDICIYKSQLLPSGWSEAAKVTSDELHSEQNPVHFISPAGEAFLFHTAQLGGDQDSCRIIMHTPDGNAKKLSLPPGSFVRSPVKVLNNGAWVLPIFSCVKRPGLRWTGSFDHASYAISHDNGQTWKHKEVPNSLGCVHMTIVDGENGELLAFFRRRQADFVYRTVSNDYGETWSTPSATDVPNNNSSISVTTLEDGRIAMVCNPSNAEMYPSERRASLYDELGTMDDRPNAEGGCNPIWGVRRAPIALCISRDGGKCFDKRIVIEDGPGTCLVNNSVNGQNKEMSYPFIYEDLDKSLHVAYTYHRRAIKYVQLTNLWQEKYGL